MLPLRLVIAKSSSGKNYLCQKNGWSSIPSYTTRPIRACETNGTEHIFVEQVIWDQNKDKWIAGGHIIASNNYNGYDYWLTRTQYEDENYDTFIVDVPGLKDVLEASKTSPRQLQVVYIDSPWYKRLYRMIKRDGFKKAINRFKYDMTAFNEFWDVLNKHNFTNVIIVRN